MKSFKIGLHILIAAVSAAAFFGEWAALAHSLKPTPNGRVEPLPALAPIQSTFDNTAANSSGLFGFQVFTPTRRTRSGGMFRTGGS